MRIIILSMLIYLSMSGEAQPIDLLLKGGRVVDPKNNIDAVMDVAITGNLVSAIATRIDASTAKKTVDVTGLYVVPGLIDMHVHVHMQMHIHMLVGM